MKFKVSTHSSNGFVGDKKVYWIKEFREQTGCGLKEAKDVSDWLTRNLDSSRSYLRGQHLVLDTNVEPEFRFLSHCPPIEFGRCDMIKRITPTLSRPTAIVALERTANKLIKLGDYEKARAVLKILVNAH